MTDDEAVTTREKATAMWEIVKFQPMFAVGIIFLGFVAALFEGLGLGFVLPIIEFAQSSGTAPSQTGGAVGAFVTVYETFGIPFELAFLILGVVLVLALRFAMSFTVAWLRTILMFRYDRHLKAESFDKALDAEIAYFDTEGSDEILNAIITQTTYAGTTIQRVVQIVQQSLLMVVYFAIAVALAPRLTIVTGVLFVGITFLVRYVVESGSEVGDVIADANERIQRAAQAGTQGVRDVRLYGMGEELRASFRDATEQYADAEVKSKRNGAAVRNAFQLLGAVAVFGLAYAALQFSSLSLSGFGVYLFAMFRLANQGSTLNNLIYMLERNIPHLVRTQEFVESLEASAESDGGSRPAPEQIDELAFESVSFGYDEETVLSDISFQVERGEYVAFVGESGAGKSTVASLIARLYEPDDGQITADGMPITEVDIASWRSRVAYVRQDPYVFDDTLHYNVAVARRDASETEIRRVCEIARVTEFVDDLPDGYETNVGDEGVRLSGGQRQRLALARALLKDADILVLDEATSDLDTRIEAEVQEAIESASGTYATVAIAHRLSTVQNADRILTLEDGEITEVGDHETLVEQSGTYAELYAKQAQ